MLDVTERRHTVGEKAVRAYPTEFELRSVPGGSKVEVAGYASTFEQPYQMFDTYGAYEETVKRGAFTTSLSRNDDVSFLINHGGLSLARTGQSGTLKLSQDDHGLHSLTVLNTARTDARDLVIAIEDQVITEMSFGFRVDRQDWSEDYSQRSLIELNLARGDVSAVNFGANPTTTIAAMRSFPTLTQERAHALETLVRASSFSAPDKAALVNILALISKADDAVDQAQPLLASIIGVPNPDADGGDDKARAAAAFELMRRRHLLEGERRTA